LRIETKEMANLTGAATFNGNEYATSFALSVILVYREVWTSYHGKFYFRVNDERNADSVLAPSEETLRAIDRVDGPHSWKIRIRKTDKKR